jgi:hypothetical protein
VTRELSRRTLVRALGLTGTSLVAGCASSSSEDTPTRAETTTVSPGSTTTKTTPGEILIESASVDTEELTAGDSLQVTVELANTDDEAARLDLQLSVGATRIATQSVELDAGAERTVELTGAPENTGTQPVVVGGERVGEVVVRAESTNQVREVGAHYYPWYGEPIHDFRGGEWSLESPSTPVLGNYNSADPEVIEQHIDWCRRAGISWLNVSWWGPSSSHDHRLQDDILAHPRADELQWSILYETIGRIGSGRVEMDAEHVQERFTSDLVYLAETYFQRDSYKHIDDRPVLYIWVSQVFGGDVESAYEAAVEEAGVDPYLVVDIPFRSGMDTHPMVEVADAVTTYNPYDVDGQSADEFVDSLETGYRTWYRAAEYVDVELVPTAMPGFDDTELTHDSRDNVPLSSKPSIYERVADTARRYADGPVLVTSFNEWYEDTQIEPSEQYGTAYLDRTSDRLATAERTQPEYDSVTFTLQFEQTVPESSLNPDIENGRDLAMMLYRLRILDASGVSTVDANIGTGTDAVTVLLGSYGPEQSGDNSWQWLGGGTRAVFSVPSLPEDGRVELEGSGATEMEIALAVDGEVRSRGVVAEDTDTVVLQL